METQNDNEPTISRRRRASQNLTKLTMPTEDVPDGCLPRIEEVQEESKELFSNFVREQMQNEHLEFPAGISQTPDISEQISTPKGYLGVYPEWAKAGRRLRYMADEFSKTKERERIRKEANNRDLQDLNPQSFNDFLMEFFDQGVTSDSILFLFFFCSDVAIRALRERGRDLCVRLYEWSLQFVTERVSEWVQQHGGWAAVLGSSCSYMKTALVCGAILLVVYGVVRFFRRNSTATS